MKKLIKLLNEYAHTYADHYDDTWEEITITFTGHYDQCFHYEVEDEPWKTKTLVDDVVISKRYEFIAWLVENKDKYLKKYEAIVSPLESVRFIRFVNWPTITTVNQSLYDSILSYLAISDNPIDDLISLLK